MSDSDSDLEPELLGDIAKLQEEIDEDNRQEEKEIEKYDKAISANEVAYEKLHSIISLLQKMLIKTQSEIKENKTMMVRAASFQNNLERFKPKMFGMPYFRDKEDRTPRPNKDVLMQRQLGMVNYLDIAPKNSWLSQDKNNLIKHILSMSRQGKIDALQKKLMHLQKNEETHERALAENYIRRQITEVQSAPLSAVAFPLDEDYDWDAISYNMDYRYKPNELQAMWKLQLHPSLKQGKISRVEHILLQNIAEQYNYQDWAKIASDLGGRRSPYQCFLMYRTVIADNHKGTKWTPEEDEYLRQTIDFYRSGNYIPWGTVSSCFENKTKMQVYARYIKSVKPDIRKGKFIPEEDAVLLAAYEHFGNDFRKITQYLPGREVNQVRQRYTMSLKKEKSSVWTVEDDRKLLHFTNSMQVDNINYSDAAKHFADKDRSAIRVRHLTLMKWLRAHPNADLRSAPRRGPRAVSSNRIERLDLRTAVERLVTRLEKDSSDPISVKSVKLEDTILNVCIKKTKEEDAFNALANTDVTINELHISVDNLRTNVFHVKCIRTLLLTLKGNVEPEFFVDSPLSLKFGMLTNEAIDEIICSTTVRTYSRKRKAEPVKSTGAMVTIWNDSPVFHKKYILPANYQTVCGMKTIFQLAYRRDLHYRKNLHLVKCSALKSHYLKLVERCEILFTWPMVMSNVIPMNLRDADEPPTDDKNTVRSQIKNMNHN